MSCLFSLLSERAHNLLARGIQEGRDWPQNALWSESHTRTGQWLWVCVWDIQGDTTDFLHKSVTSKYIHTKYIQHRKKKKNRWHIFLEEMFVFLHATHTAAYADWCRQDFWGLQYLSFFICDYQFASASFPLRWWWGWEDKGKENVSMKEKLKINIEAEKVQLIQGQHCTNWPSCKSASHPTSHPFMLQVRAKCNI